MIQLKKILFATDFSRCANQALTHALYLAKKYQAEMHIFHAIILYEDDPHNPAYHLPNVEKIRAQLEEIANTQMIADLEAYQVEDLVIKQSQRRGISTTSTILDYVSEEDIDLIVMGTHGRRRLRDLLGSIAEGVVRLAPCPVLTIREQTEPTPIEAIQRILVPVDFSDCARQALKYAKEIAAYYEARLQVLHVIEQGILPSFYPSDTAPKPDFIPDMEVKSTKTMERMLKETQGTEVTADFHVIEGHAARDIAKFAENHDTDLIVISTHGLTGIKHLFLGSVAEKVVRRAPCPVFSVKAFGKSLLED